MMNFREVFVLYLDLDLGVSLAEVLPESPLFL